MEKNYFLTYEEFINFLNLVDKNKKDKFSKQDFENLHKITLFLFRKIIDVNDFDLINKDYLKLAIALHIYQNITKNSLVNELLTIIRTNNNNFLNNTSSIVNNLLTIAKQEKDHIFKYENLDEIIKLINSKILTKDKEEIFKNLPLYIKKYYKEKSLEKNVLNTKTLPLTYPNHESSISVSNQLLLNQENIRKFNDIKNHFNIIQKQISKIEQQLGGFVFSGSLVKSYNEYNIKKSERYLIKFDTLPINYYFDFYKNNDENIAFKLKDGVVLTKGDYTFNLKYNVTFNDVVWQKNDALASSSLWLELYKSEDNLLNKIIDNAVKITDIKFSDGNDQNHYGKKSFAITIHEDLHDAYFAISFYGKNIDNFNLVINSQWILEVTSLGVEISNIEVVDQNIWSTSDIHELSDKTQKNINEYFIEAIDNLHIQIDNILPIGTKIISGSNDLEQFSIGKWILIKKINNLDLYGDKNDNNLLNNKVSYIFERTL